MKVLHSWLAEMVDLPDDPDVVATAMNTIGLAVDEIVAVGAPVPGVIVAQVLETRRHPKADKVQQVFVDTGDGAPRHVWCGAFNMQAGDLVPLATIGTVMPDGRDIQRRKILGEVSEGMLCSGIELGLSSDAAGILILPPGLPLGADVFEALAVPRDVVYDLDLTRNRPDAYCHLGVARDLAAHLGLSLRVPGTPAIPVDGDARTTPVTIVDGDRCGRFVAVVLSGVSVGPSPAWLADRLTRAGMRPINNVVDVSNAVMLELGQPNHAYDLERLGGGAFRIRRARHGERITTLDDVERALTDADLLICDGHDVPIGIGGVMGGADTEIHEGTTVVALEMAWFDPTGIGHTAARLNLRSEASARFERGTDPYVIDRAVDRFVTLLRETCPGLVVHDGVSDPRAELPAQERSTTVRTSEVHRILGTALTGDQIAALIDPIGFTTTADTDGRRLRVALPSWRPDCTVEIDVIEEIARHYGYERLGRTVPKSTVHGGLSRLQARRRLAHEVLLGLGCTEAMPNPFLSPGDQERAGVTGPVLRIANPLVAEESVLRTSLRPGLVRAVAYNASHRAAGVSLYEIGHVYPPGDGPLPDEFEALGVVLAGREAPDAVRVLQELLVALGVQDRVRVGLAPERVPGLHPTRCATVVGPAGTALGAVGEIDPAVLDALGVGERVAVLEVDLSALLALEESVPQARPVSRFPSSDIDLAFVAGPELAASELADGLREAAGALLVGLELFDVYRGPGVPEGHRSLAFRLRLQAPDRTLTDTEVADLRTRAIAAASRVGATLRA
jgi:phenylalanyl-tRNA synthetase beta chain